MNNCKTGVKPLNMRERSLQHFSSIRIPFDDCRIPGDEMPHFSGVKPWVARDLIVAVEKQRDVIVGEDNWDWDFAEGDFIANAFIRSNGVWYLVGTGDYHNRYGVHCIPVTKLKDVNVEKDDLFHSYTRIEKYDFFRRYDPSVIKEIMQERLNPPPEKTASGLTADGKSATGQAEVKEKKKKSNAKWIILGISALLFICIGIGGVQILELLGSFLWVFLRTTLLVVGLGIFIYTFIQIWVFLVS